MVDVVVTGLAELTRNLIEFAGDKVAGRAALTALGAGGRIIRAAAVKNARGIGLGRMGVFDRPDGKGPTRRYGRIPASLSIGRAYVKNGTAEHVIRVYAKRGKGLARAKAPHAHLIEDGWLHKSPKGSTRTWVQARPFLRPALISHQNAALEAMTKSMQRSLWRAHFATTGKGA